MLIRASVIRNGSIRKNHIRTLAPIKLDLTDPTQVRSGRRVIRTLKCLYTIFSRYLALPMTILPYNSELDRIRTGIFFRDREALYQLSY